MIINLTKLLFPIFTIVYLSFYQNLFISPSDFNNFRKGCLCCLNFHWKITFSVASILGKNLALPRFSEQIFTPTSASFPTSPISCQIILYLLLYYLTFIFFQSFFPFSIFSWLYFLANYSASRYLIQFSFTFYFVLSFLPFLRLLFKEIMISYL